MSFLERFLYVTSIFYQFSKLNDMFSLTYSFILCLKLRQLTHLYFEIADKKLKVLSHRTVPISSSFVVIVFCKSTQAGCGTALSGLLELNKTYTFKCWL